MPKNLKNNVLPGLFTQDRPIKIWSAPCSNGSEPYTLAIILKELKYDEQQYEILASDLDFNILEDAKNAVYNPDSVHNVPPKILKQYFNRFKETPIKYKLNEEIIKKVTFEQKNLINDSYTKGWDLILSRNLFIYLSSNIKEMLTLKFTEALNPGGYLFLGNTEFIFNPKNFGLEKINSSFYRKL